MYTVPSPAESVDPVMNPRAIDAVVEVGVGVSISSEADVLHFLFRTMSSSRLSLPPSMICSASESSNLSLSTWGEFGEISLDRLHG